MEHCYGLNLILWMYDKITKVKHTHTHTQLHVKRAGPVFANFSCYKSSVGVNGLCGQCLSMHAPHMVLSWARIHHAGPAKQVLHLETETSPTVAISQISYSYNMATFCFGLPRPFTPALANPFEKYFLGEPTIPILTICPMHRMRVLLSIVGICSMSHLAATFTLLSFCHHFALNSLCRKPMWMALNFLAWACVSAHDSHS